jgi:hypothetical protein
MAMSNANTPSSMRPMGGKGMSTGPMKSNAKSTANSPISTRPGSGKKTMFFVKKGAKKK